MRFKLNASDPGRDYSMGSSVEIFEPSSLETIDTAVYNYVNDTLHLHTTTNKGWEKVPVLWMGAERAFQVKSDRELRDSVGKLNLPLITVSRASVVRDDTFKGAFQALTSERRGRGDGVAEITKVIKQDKTRNFVNADRNRSTKGDETGPFDSNKIVYQTITVPQPNYVTCMFDVNIRTEYQQQMNDILPSFVLSTKADVIEYNGHRYELFIEGEYGLKNNINQLSVEERMFEAKVKLKVLGYLVGDGINREVPQIIRKENQVQVRISRERVIVGDTRPWANDDGKYRE